MIPDERLATITGLADRLLALLGSAQTGRSRPKLAPERPPKYGKGEASEPGINSGETEARHRSLTPCQECEGLTPQNCLTIDRLKTENCLTIDRLKIGAKF